MSRSLDERIAVVENDVETLKEKLEKHEDGCEKRHKVLNETIGEIKEETIVQGQDIKHLVSSVNKLTGLVEKNTESRIVQNVKIAGITTGLILILGIIARWAWPLIVA